jgi:hypothetical protein
MLPRETNLNSFEARQAYPPPLVEDIESGQWRRSQELLSNLSTSEQNFFLQTIQEVNQKYQHLCLKFGVKPTWLRPVFSQNLKTPAAFQLTSTNRGRILVNYDLFASDPESLYLNLFHEFNHALLSYRNINFSNLDLIGQSGRYLVSTLQIGFQARVTHIDVVRERDLDNLESDLINATRIINVMATADFQSDILEGAKYIKRTVLNLTSLGPLAGSILEDYEFITEQLVENKLELIQEIRTNDYIQTKTGEYCFLLKKPSGFYESTVKSGLALDEAVAELFTLIYGARGEVDRETILHKTGYSDYTNRLNEFMEFLVNSGLVSLDQFISSLMKFRMENQPGKFLDWVNQKTSLKISLSDLMNLNLYPYLETLSGDRLVKTGQIN